MAIEVSCDHCGKKYRLDDQFAGKKAKCKKCGETFVIPAAPAGAKPASKPAAKLVRPAAGAAVKTKPPTKPAAPARSAPPPSLRAGETPVDDYDLAPTDAPPAGAAVSVSQGRCPGCGGDLPESAVLCVSCGYNRRTGKAVATQVGGGLPKKQGPSILRPPEEKQSEYRDNKEYTHPTLMLLDGVGSVLAALLYVVWQIAFTIHSVTALPANANVSSMMPVLAGLGQLVIVVVFIAPMLTLAVWVAGRIMKFDLPKGAVARALACLTLSVAPFVLLDLCQSGLPINPFLWSRPWSQPGLLSSYLHMMGPFAYVTLAFAPALAFLTFWFFFRLRVREVFLAAGLAAVGLALGLAVGGVLEYWLQRAIMHAVVSGAS